MGESRGEDTVSKEKRVDGSGEEDEDGEREMEEASRHGHVIQDVMWHLPQRPTTIGLLQAAASHFRGQYRRPTGRQGHALMPARRAVVG